MERISELRSPPSRSRWWARILFSLALLLIGLPISAQPPHAQWRTLEIPGFRFHTPVESEPWARHVVAHMENIQSRVEAAVGFSPEQTIDVLVIDPTGRANGVAWPILSRPRMVLYTTPPGADSVLGYFEDWSELLVLHEAVHLAHLLRPSRNPRLEILERLVPVGPLPRKAPNWVIEGYATMLEGRLTGWGRPHGDYRAALLRRWAQMGVLPTYGGLSGDSRRWLGRSFPYLVGSAYLEWLEERAGDDSLRNLWARLSARRDRSFENAFRGVFGEGPAKLYHRFVAELTFRAMSIEENIQGSLEEGDLWMDLSWRTGAPDVSPDGERLVAVVRKRGMPSRLVIWSTQDDPEAAAERQRLQDQVLELDPEDVAAVPLPVLPRKPLHELPAFHGASPFEPRFSADGESVLFVRFGPGSQASAFPGARIADLYRWWPESGLVERITRDAGVRRPDPSADGQWAVAVRHPHGLSELVRIELATGRVEPLIDRPPSVHEVIDSPRLSPNDERLLYLSRRAGGWKIVARHLASGTEIELPTPPRATVMSPAWTPEGRVVATLGVGGFLDIHRFETTSAARRRITRSAGGALAPAPSSDGSLFFLALEEDGLDIRRIQVRGPEAAPPPPPWPRADFNLAGLAPAVRPPQQSALPVEIDRAGKTPSKGRGTAEHLEVEDPALEVQSSDYGIGPREHLPLFGGGWGPDGGRFEFGLRQGDPVGRLELWLLGAVADPGAGAEGFGFATRWRGKPVEVAIRAFSTEERFGHDRDLHRADTIIDHQGLEISVRRGVQGHLFSWSAEAGALWDQSEVSASQHKIDLERKVAFARGAGSLRQSWGAWRADQTLAAAGYWGETEGESWQRHVYEASLRIGRQPVDGRRWRLGMIYRRGGSEDLVHDVDRFELGGASGSLLPASARARINVPALPSGFAVGDEVETQRLELELDRRPITLFGERHRIWISPEHRPWLRLAGLEWTLRRGAQPLLRLPGVELSLGIAQILDEPFEDQTEGWIHLRWRP